LYNVSVGELALSDALLTGGSNTASGYAALANNTTGGSNTASGYAALFSNTTGSNNTASGYTALYSNTSGSNNTASGHSSLYNNTSGSNNTASGHAALYSNTTGHGNTASGRNALQDNTTGLNNTASGYSALANNITGNSNTASGYAALFSNTTGDNNTASGRSALANNITGLRNTASGYAALANNTTGSDNTATGYTTLYNNTSGSNNTASGRNALIYNTTGLNNTASGAFTLQDNTTGNNNTASGYSSLFSNTSGSNNTASGRNALYSNTTGGDNTAVGYQAGRYQADGSTALTDASNSVFIGTNTRGVNGDTNQIVIGVAAIGLGSNTTVLGNDSIVTTALKGNVGIGTTSPSHALDVVGSANIDATGSYKKEGATVLDFDSVKLNASVGWQALSDALLTGTANTAAGFAALQSNTTGTSNTASGYVALQNNTTGDFNTASGRNALQNNTTGSYNTAVGRNALQGNTEGINNTASGRSALELNTTGDFNTASGYAALQNNTIGDYNTAVGHQAGRYQADGSTALADASDSVFIGKNTRGVGGATNQIAIGDTAIGLGSNTAVLGNDSIVTTALKGNVGIGTTTPSHSLDVVGSANIDATGSYKKEGATILDYDSTLFNVSVGDSALGDALLTGVSNVATGYQALYSHTTGSYNVATGHQALYSNMAGVSNVATGYRALFVNTEGSYNVATGVQALFVNTSGNYNVATGFQTLFGNTTGFSNIATGRQALYNNTTGNYNVANGYRALFSNTEGGNNVATGQQALYSNTTGNYNVANGYLALYSNTEGNYNVANGYRALFSNTEGSYNVATGRDALLYNTTGNYNTASGVYALNNNTEGNNNTASGHAALYSNTTGSGNTASGYQAGRYQADGSTALTDASNSVFIGTNTRGVNGATNQIVIGVAAIGLGSNTTVLGNDSIVTTALKGNVGIGTAAPGAKLHIESTSLLFEGLRIESKNNVASGRGVYQSYWVQSGVGSSRYGGNITVANDATAAGTYMSFATNYAATVTEKMRIDADGNVGIGTTSPASPLHVAQDDTTTGSNNGLTLEQGGAGDAMIQFLLTGVERWLVGVDNSDAYKFKIEDGSALSTGAAFTIDTTGNVGIGTTTPGAALDVATTWNDGATVFTGIKADVTNTASAAGSKLMDFQVGGASKFSVDATGLVTVGGVGVIKSPSNLFFDSTAYFASTAVGTSRVSIGNGVKVGSSYAYEFSATTGANGTADLLLTRDSAGTLAQRDGVNAQTFRIYNTDDGAGNKEYLSVAWSANDAVLTVDSEGAGLNRPLFIRGQTLFLGGARGANHWKISTAGHLLDQSDGTHNIGQLGSNRPNSIYLTGAIGLNGATPPAQAAHVAAATDAATTQTLVNALRTALIDLGAMAAS
jgi:hypothetical protein